MFAVLVNIRIPALESKGPVSVQTQMRKKKRRTSEEKQAFVENMWGKKAVQWCENRRAIIANAFSRFQPGSGIMTLYKKFMGTADAVDALI